MLVLSSPMVKRLARDVSDTFTTHASLVPDVINTHCRTQNGSAHGRVVATFKRDVSSLRFPFKFLRQRYLNKEEIRQVVSLLVFGCSPSCQPHGVISGRIPHSEFFDTSSKHKLITPLQENAGSQFTVSCTTQSESVSANTTKSERTTKTYSFAMADHTRLSRARVGACACVRARACVRACVCVYACVRISGQNLRFTNLQLTERD